MSYTNNITDQIRELEGKVIKSITGLEKGADEVHIFTECGEEYMFWHCQNCCEFVRLEDFECDDLEGALILTAEVVTDYDYDYEDDHDSFESCTWTFYKIETNKGGLWMRWFGESNGYYSESVDFSCRPKGQSQ